MNAIWHAGGRLASLLRAAARGALDAVLPPQCLSCRVEVEEPDGLCPACWSRLSFITAPFCARCGLPFPHPVGDGALCAACLRRPPPYDRARASLRYDEASRGLILAFKHGDRMAAAPALARFLARAGAELLAEADLLAPVPLHYFRLVGRRYNQSALLALALGRLAGRPVATDLLRRTRATPSQGGLDARARRRNVAGAFAPAPSRLPLIEGARVLLIDDVHTTGATVEACARSLKAAGARAVDILSVARVVRPAGNTI